jgi:Leucine-rich repeat (LRR) protein
MVGNLRQLRELNVSNNELVSLPTEIRVLKNLAILDCSFNLIRELPKGIYIFIIRKFDFNLINIEISECSSLSKLILTKNDLTSIPKEIGNLNSLLLLNLADNFIELLPIEIGKLTNLTKLYVDHNDLFEISNQIGNLTKLKELNISANQLVDLPNSISNLINLHILDLNENNFDNNQYNTSDIDSFLIFMKNKPISNSGSLTLKQNENKRRRRSRQDKSSKLISNVQQKVSQWELNQSTNQLNNNNNNNNNNKKAEEWFVELKKHLFRIKGFERVCIR